MSGQINAPGDLAADDWRRSNPRFQGENFHKNLELVRRVQEIAREKSCTPAQLALAWLLSQGHDIVPIPGTRRRERVDENAAASAVTLAEKDLANIESVMAQDVAAGSRYPEPMMALLNA